MNQNNVASGTSHRDISFEVSVRALACCRIGGHRDDGGSKIAVKLSHCLLKGKKNWFNVSI